MVFAVLVRDTMKSVIQSWRNVCLRRAPLAIVRVATTCALQCVVSSLMAVNRHGEPWKSSRAAVDPAARESLENL